MVYHTDLNEENQHQWHLETDFSCSKKYDQFINWLGMEYYFFQQVHGSFYTIYFPNGHVKIEKTAKANNTFVSKITVKSKCLKYGLKMRKNLSAFIDYINKYHALST